jgi:glucose/arabinose dehydrogenase
MIGAATKHIRTVAGNGGRGGDCDGGPANRARLDRPHGVAVDPDGSCWIADTNNHRVRRVGPTR